MTMYLPFLPFSFAYAEVGALVTGMANLLAGEVWKDRATKLAGCCTARRASGDMIMTGKLGLLV